ncbi:MAG TPA: hypothetical protein VK530_04705 [Candidatus Acidoferrum sp.]|nr:hypothetical protein [Candidatus Acidoferrum sp.]
MKTNHLKTLCAVALIAAAASVSANDAKIEALKKEFSTVRTLELPARAASTISAVSKADRAALVDDVVRAALGVNASGGSLLVGAIARSTPDVAADSAVTATSLQPKQLLPITKAAIGGAPGEAEAIVSALTKARPAAFATIGIAAVEVAPGSAEAILNGITEANPTLKSLISRFDTKRAKSPAAVVSVLKRTETLLVKLSNTSKNTPEAILASELSPAMTAQLPGLTSTVLAAPPIVGPPYAPGSPTPGEINTSQNNIAPPGGRDYSAP